MSVSSIGHDPDRSKPNPTNPKLHTRVRTASGQLTKTAKWTSSNIETCRICRTPIDIGAHFVRGRAKEPYHPSCKRLSVRPSVAGVHYMACLPPSRSRDLTCESCGDLIRADERMTSHLGRAWHRNCRLREITWTGEKRLAAKKAAEM